MARSPQAEPLSQRLRHLPLPVKLAALGVVVTLALGVVVQVTAPSPPLIVVADSGMFAEGSEFSGEGEGSWSIEYQATPELSREPGSGSVFEMVLEGNPEDTLEALAPLFGLSGPAVQSRDYSTQWPGYVLGDEDWTKPSLVLSWSGSGSWFYTNPDAYPEPVCAEVAPEENSDDVLGWECAPANPALALPSASEARQKAWELFRQAGLEANFDDVTVLTEDEWGVGVSVSTRVQGEPTALEWTMFWAPGPVLASVSGHAARAVYRGEFDTISPFTAVERLSSGSWWGAPAVDYDAQGEDFSSPDGLSIEEDFFDSPIMIGDSSPTSLLVWDSSGGQWLVPGYFLSFGERDAERTTVVSLTEDTFQIQVAPEDQPVPEPDIALQRGTP